LAEYLGPFELRGEIGRGAMAVVWRGYDPTLDREVALKEPFVTPGIDPAVAAELAARFIREGRAAARLNHPGIVTIYSAEAYDGRPVIAMELIDGRTLADILDSGPLDPATTVALIDQLLAAVGYAHAAGVVHRDIKPDNVFVTSDGRAKLADFGIAHVGADASLTMAGSVMGTPGYMAPEQIAGQPVDARADLFAVGVMAHEMLTGRNPYGATEGTAATAVMYRIVHEPLPALGVRTPAGVDIDAVLAVATAKDPAQRFADAGSFRAALSGGAIPTIVPGQAYAPAPATAGTKATWLSYALVGGIGTLALAGLLIASGGGAATGSGVPAPPAPVATATVPAAEPEPVAVGVEASLNHLATGSASSTLASSRAAGYDPRYLLDSDPMTCWAEGVRGHGEGSWVRFDFSEPVYISRIGVVIGYDKHVDGWDRWVTNSRMREATFELSSGTSMRRSYLDSREMQFVDFDEPIRVTSVTMNIDAVYPGQAAYGHKAAADTSLSTVDIKGWTAASVGE